MLSSPPQRCFERTRLWLPLSYPTCNLLTQLLWFFPWQSAGERRNSAAHDTPDHGLWNNLWNMATSDRKEGWELLLSCVPRKEKNVVGFLTTSTLLTVLFFSYVFFFAWVAITSKHSLLWHLLCVSLLCSSCLSLFLMRKRKKKFNLGVNRKPVLRWFFGVTGIFYMLSIKGLKVANTKMSTTLVRKSLT